MSLRRGKVLRQKVLVRVAPNTPHTLSFWTSVTGVNHVDLRVVMRLRFKNEAGEDGPCRRAVCNFNQRALAKRVGSANGAWQKVIIPNFTLPWNYTELEGQTDFVLFQLLAGDQVPAVPTGRGGRTEGG